jgi:predicted CopG family antitoxin
MKTVALREDTYAELAALKAALGFRSFDDVVRFLLSAYRRQN